MGLPAKVVRRVDADLTRRIEQTWKHYVEQSRRHREGLFPPV
jgi:carbonic anhydrase/acetyltransferase-like protein (isoleucine patch superfamily)